MQNKWQLSATQVVAGLATGLIEPAWDALFTEGIETVSAKLWSIWAGDTHLLTGVAAFVGGIIAAVYSFTVLFISMAFIDLVAVFLCWRGGLREPARAADAAPVAVWVNESSIQARNWAGRIGPSDGREVLFLGNRAVAHPRDGKLGHKVGPNEMTSAINTVLEWIQTEKTTMADVANVRARRPDLLELIPMPKP